MWNDTVECIKNKMEKNVTINRCSIPLNDDEGREENIGEGWRGRYRISRGLSACTLLGEVCSAD